MRRFSTGSKTITERFVKVVSKGEVEEILLANNYTIYDGQFVVRGSEKYNLQDILYVAGKALVLDNPDVGFSEVVVPSNELDENANVVFLFRVTKVPNVLLTAFDVRMPDFVYTSN